MDRRFKAQAQTGAQGRIRTSVARKERQIYSLLPLTTRPPVQKRRKFQLSQSMFRSARRMPAHRRMLREESGRCEHTSAPGSLHFGKFLMECVLGDPAVPPPTLLLLPCVFPETILELAKGFEPLTL